MGQAAAGPIPNTPRPPAPRRFPAGLLGFLRIAVLVNTTVGCTTVTTGSVIAGAGGTSTTTYVTTSAGTGGATTSTTSGTGSCGAPNDCEMKYLGICRTGAHCPCTN